MLILSLDAPLDIDFAFWSIMSPTPDDLIAPNMGRVRFLYIVLDKEDAHLLDIPFSLGHPLSSLLERLHFSKKQLHRILVGFDAHPASSSASQES
jgi:hypothetical protein